MRVIFALLALGLACGCVSDTMRTAATTTTRTVTTTAASTTIEDFIVITASTAGTATVTTTAFEGETTTTLNPLIGSFKDSGGPVCLSLGKPVIRMYGRKDCVHCEWVGPVFDKVAKEYVGEGLIVAHHWVFDRNDDTLTDEVEGQIPDSEWDVYLKGNQTTVPYFNFGCKYTRTGTAYYVRDDKDMEGGEFRAVIQQLLNNV